jgi:TP901 family phage tail tape measure protein
VAEAIEILVALKTNEAIASFNGMMAKFSGQNFTAIGNAMTAGLTVPIVAGLGVATSEAVKFNSAMQSSARTLSLSKTETAALSKEILTMAPSLGLLPTEFANVAAEAGKLGVAKNEVAAFGKVLASLSTITDVPIGEFTKKAGAIKTIFQQNTAEFEKFGAAVNTLDDNIGGTTPNILEFTARVGAIGKSVGLTAGEVAAFGAVFETVGIAPERASTAFQNFANQLFTINAASPNARAAFESMGYSAATFGQTMRANPTAALSEFLGRLNAIPDPVQRSELLIKIFGKSSSAEIAALATQSGKLSEAFKMAGNDTANLAKMQSEVANKMNDPAVQAKVLQAQFNALGIQIGSVLVPLLSQLLQVITPVAQKMSAFLANNPEWAKFFVVAAGGAAVLGPLVIAIGSVVTAVSTIGTAVAGASAAFAGLGAATTGLGAVMGGVGAAVTGFGAALFSVPALITAVVAAIAALTFNVGGCRDVLMNFAAYLGGQLVAALNTARNAVASFAQPIMALFQNVVASVKSALDTTISSVTSLAQPVVAQFQYIGFSIQSTFLGGLNSITQAINNIKSAAAGIATPIQQGIQSGMSTIQSLASNMVSQVRSAVSQAAAAVKEAVPTFLNAGSSLMQSFAQGVANSAGAAYKSVSDSVKSVRNLLPSSPAKEGPLSDLDKAGQALLGTFAANVNGDALISRLSGILSNLPLAPQQQQPQFATVGPSLVQTKAPSMATTGQPPNQGSVVINYTQNVDISSNMTGSEIVVALKSAQGQFLDYLSRSEFFKNRKQS